MLPILFPGLPFIIGKYPVNITDFQSSLLRFAYQNSVATPPIVGQSIDVSHQARP